MKISVIQQTISSKNTYIRLIIYLLLALWTPIFLFIATQSFVAWWLPLFLFCGLILALFLPKIPKGHIFTEMIIAFIPFISVYLFQSHFVFEGLPKANGFLALQFSLILWPIVIYGDRKPTYWGSAVALMFITWVFFPDIHGYIGNTIILMENMPLLQYGTWLLAFIFSAVIVKWINDNQQTAQVHREKIEAQMVQLEAEALQANKTLQEHLTKIQETTHESELRNWLAEGIAETGKILREARSRQEAYDLALAFLVRHIGANQGCLYLQEETAGIAYLEAQATYAYGKKKHINQRIEKGQGLVGQAFHEHEAILLNKVPEDYVKITSGLGQATPSAVAIHPLIHGEKIEGVLELATFDTFEPHKIAFLEKAGEVLAANISNIRLNNITQKLLKESQEQTEIMKSQEEEMRQNLEELQATQEEMARQSKSNKQFSEAVNNASIIMEYNPEGRFTHVNDQFVALTGYQKAEIVGRNRTFCYYSKSGGQPASDNLWRKMQQGNQVITDIEQVKKDGERYWLRASHMPIMNQNGQLEKVSCICFEISQEKNREIEIRNFTNAVDNTSIIIDLNKHGKVVHVNKKFVEEVGYSREEIIGQPHTYYVPAHALKSGAFEQLWEDLSKGQHFVRDVERVKKNGDSLWLRASYMPMFDEDGHLDRISCICMDITLERIKAQETQKFNRAVDNLLLIVNFDQNGIVTHANQKFVETTGYALEEAIGQPNTFWWAEGAKKNGQFEKLWDRLATGNAATLEVTRIKKNKEKLLLRASYAPILDENDNMEQISCIALEISPVDN